MKPRRTVAVYCATFLPSEARHLHRQLGAVRRFPVRVFTRKRVNADVFPFENLAVLPDSPGRALRRVVDRQIFERPMLLTGGETRRLRAGLDACRCALLHIVYGNTAVELLPLLRQPTRRFPAIVSFHGADARLPLGQPAHRRAFKEMLGRMDLVLARSQSLLDALRRLGCPPSKLRLNRTGIPLEQFPFQARVWPADGRWRLLQACRLIEKKGLFTALQAFARFAPVHPQATLTIAGEGPLRSDLESLAAQLRLNGKVRFTGFLGPDDLRRELSAAHAFLHPSRTASNGNQEGVPNALLEAMSAGLPVFATRHGGIPEAIQDRATGFLVPERDAGALADALLVAVTHPASLSAVAAAGARSVAENFGLEAQARKLEDHYQEAMEEAWVSAD